MKIAVWHNLPSGGAKRALYDHVKGLKQSGHHIESWCPQTASQDYLPLNELVQEHIIPVKEQMIGSRLMPEMYAYYRNMVKSIKGMDRHCQLCAEEINEGSFDLLFANTCQILKVSPISQYVNIPKVIYLQEPNRRLYEAMPALPWIAPDTPENVFGTPRYYYQVLKNSLKVHLLGTLAREEQINAGFFDSILANSLYSIESIYKVFGIKAKLCYLGVDLNKFQYKKFKREDFVVGIGAFNPSKNIEFVLRSLSLVKKDQPKLVWIGNSASGNYLNSILELSKSLKVDFDYKLNIKDHDLVDILNRASAMVYAPHLEPFGFAAIEAGACGLPVITVAEGGMRESVQNNVNGIVVEYDEKQMAEAIELIMKNKGLARKLGENGHKLVSKKWSVESSVKRLEDRFSEVVENNLI